MQIACCPFSQRGKKIFPTWENFIPTVGKLITCMETGIKRPNDLMILSVFRPKNGLFLLILPRICHYCTQSAPPNSLTINECCRSGRFATKKFFIVRVLGNKVFCFVLFSLIRRFSSTKSTFLLTQEDTIARQ